MVVKVFCELGNTFSIGLCFELEALGTEKCLQFLVVGDDAIVDNGKLPSWVRPANV